MIPDIPSKNLKGKVIVITGASSGIGRATAIKFGKCEASVVVAARRERMLADVCAEINAAGGESHYVVTDVSDPAQVKNLFEQSMKKFGKIDVWINNAGVIAFGAIQKIPFDVTNRVIKVNLLGSIYGLKAVLPYFMQQDSGELINIGSILGTMAQPYSSAYVASKFGIKGYTDGLRMELFNTKIKVCLVLPASIDTPFFHHAANFTGHEIKVIRPIYDPNIVADAIVDLVFRPKNEVVVGASSRLIIAHHILPSILKNFFGEEFTAKQALKDVPTTNGNLFEPMYDEMTIKGGWKEKLEGEQE